MLARRSVGEVRDAKARGYRTPLRIGTLAAKLRRSRSVLQCPAGRAVGKGIVRDADGVFVGSDHIADRVAAVGIRRNAIAPETCSLAHQRETLAAQPLPVLRHTVIVPAGDGDIGCNMMFERTGEGKGRRSLLAPVIPFPGEHRAPIAVGVGPTTGRIESVGSVIEHLARQAGPEHQQRRIHPDFRIPEDMTVVKAPGRKAHRRNTPATAFTDRAVKVEQGETHIQLCRGIAFDLDIALPQLRPFPFVCRNELRRSLPGCINSLPFRLIPRVGESGCSTDCSHKGERRPAALAQNNPHAFR